LIKFSILAVAAEMAQCIFLEMLSENALPILFLFLLLCNIVPIYYNSHQPWTAARTRSYLNYILKVYFFATIIYVLLCATFAYITFTRPGTLFDTTVKQMNECGYRYKENKCGSLKTGFFTRVWRMAVERECFALAMCLRQPVFVLKIHAFLMEVWAQVLADGSLFVVLVGVFLALTLSRGEWTTFMISNSKVVNGVHTTITTPLPPAPKSTAPAVEAAFEEVQHGIQEQTHPLERVTSIQRSSPEDVYLPALPQGRSLGRSPPRLRRHPLAQNHVIAR
jgi:hypothetical protein